LDDISLYEINDISITTPKTQLYPNQSTWLYASTKLDEIEWFVNDTLTSLSNADSILVQPQQTTTYYIKSLQCRYTSWDSIIIEVLPEPLLPVEVKIVNNLNDKVFNIQYTGDFRPLLTAAIFNTVGQIVKTITFSESIEVPIEYLASGVYFCRISSQGIPILTERVVKVR